MVAVLAVCLAGAVLWLENTSDPAFLPQPSIPVTEPGAAVTVVTSDGGCTAPFVTWRRRGLLGRWQQTHVDGERDVIPWYNTRRHSVASPMPCVPFPRTLEVPVDIDYGLVAACTIDDRCVQVIVAEGDQTVTQPSSAAD